MFASYARFEITRISRNARYLIFTLFGPTAIFLFNAGATKSKVGGLPWAAYFMISMAAYGALGAALNASGFRLATERASGWVRQLRSTPLTDRAWLGTKVLVSIVLGLPAVLIVVALAIATHGVDGNVGEWVALVAALAAGSVPFAFLGLALGSLLDPDACQAASIAAYLLIAFLGGLFYPITSFPTALRYVADALPASHVAAVARAVFVGHTPQPGDLLGVAAWIVALGAVALWAHRRAEVAVAP